MTVPEAPRVLFSPCYAEPLKAMLPLMNAARSSFDVFVLNTVSWVDDRDKSERILRNGGVAFATEPELSAESLAQRGRLVRSLHRLDSRYHRLTKGILADALVAYAWEHYWRTVARRWLDRIQPAALVVAGETNPIQKHLIEEANRRGIPSVTLQWGINNASPRHAREMAERLEKRHAAMTSRRHRARQRLVSLVRDILVRTAGLQVHIPSPIFGAGHATKFAVIGDGCLDNYVAMGIPREKMVVVGYPIYEDLYRRAPALTNDTNQRSRALRALGIAENARLILWCTNDQRGYWYGFHTYEQMLASWRRKLDILLEESANHIVVLKLHPKEVLSDYLPLTSASDRLRIVCEPTNLHGVKLAESVRSQVRITQMDVREILPHADLVVTRFSGTAVDGLCLGRLVVSHNAPPIPGGTLYEDLGGTLHAKTDQEFATAIRGLLGDGVLLQTAASRRRKFLSRYLRVEAEPATVRFVRLLEDLIHEASPGKMRLASATERGVRRSERPVGALDS